MFLAVIVTWCTKLESNLLYYRRVRLPTVVELQIVFWYIYLKHCYKSFWGAVQLFYTWMIFQVGLKFSYTSRFIFSWSGVNWNENRCRAGVDEYVQNIIAGIACLSPNLTYIGIVLKFVYIAYFEHETIKNHKLYVLAAPTVSSPLTQTHERLDKSPQRLV